MVPAAFDPKFLFVARSPLSADHDPTITTPSMFLVLNFV